MADRKWLDNAFWETPQKQILNAISETTEGNREVRQVHKINAVNEDGTQNELYKEVIEFLGEDAIDESSAKRLAKKQAEAEMEKEKQLEQERAKKLEKLFEYKLETFEIPEIKDSKNRALKSKLRRAKSVPEVNLYAMMLIQEIIDNESGD